MLHLFLSIIVMEDLLTQLSEHFFVHTFAPADNIFHEWFIIFMNNSVKEWSVIFVRMLGLFRGRLDF